ncbi:alpha/beta hydrolase [Streptomyces sp. NPDC001137]|uniref:alpha/beta hydrolase n=1 Tax=Streptomyces sp. NPDC001137 TaxID=3154378 RepID=UPI0033311335
MVLDTALDDTTTPTERILREAATAEEAFHPFTAWCAASTDCPLHGKDSATECDALVARADRTPIPTAGCIRALTGEDIRAATQDYLTLSGVTLPALAQAVVKAQAGDASDFTCEPADTLDPVQVQVPPAWTPRPVTTFDQLARLRDDLARISPHLGGAVRSWTALTGCLGWPVPAHAVAAGSSIHGAPPALVLQSTHQALAPHSAGFAMAAQLPGSVVLSREGDGHSAHGADNRRAANTDSRVALRR